MDEEKKRRSKGDREGGPGMKKVGEMKAGREDVRQGNRRGKTKAGRGKRRQDFGKRADREEGHHVGRTV